MKLGDNAWYMLENKLHQGTIWSIMTVENQYDDWCHTEKQKEIWQPFGLPGTYYATCHGVINANVAYATKADLAASL